MVRDIAGERARPVRVVYRGSVPDLFKAGRDVNVKGRAPERRLRRDETRRTKCPRKYTPEQTSD